MITILFIFDVLFKHMFRYNIQYLSYIFLMYYIFNIKHMIYQYNSLYI